MAPLPVPRSRTPRRLAQARQRRLDQRLRLRPRDEHGRTDGEIASVELARTDEVGDGLAERALRHEQVELRVLRFGEHVHRVGREPGPVHARAGAQASTRASTRPMRAGGFLERDGQRAHQGASHAAPRTCTCKG